MRYADWLKLEKSIADADESTIFRRWAYGRRLLDNPTIMSASGKSLRHGVLQQLLAATKAKGYRLSSREIQWRLQAARTYPGEAEIRTACSLFESWSELREAKFPAVNTPDDDFPELDIEDPVPAAPAGWTQLDLFPSATPASTLADLEQYAKAQRRMTENFAARDERRADLLARLVAAAGGDLSATVEEALRALGERKFGGQDVDDTT